MFTGIVTAIGRIVESVPAGEGCRLRIDAGSLDLTDVSIGDSIAVNGCCLTAVRIHSGAFEADVSRETLDCTVGLDRLGEVNLEKSLRLADRLGGHLVSGHVDGVGEVTRFDAIGESHVLAIRVPEALAPYIARKGSVCVQGVSLTVNRIEGTLFEVNLIPHTLAATTLKLLRAGSQVNLEVDMIARYVERLMQGGS